MLPELHTVGHKSIHTTGTVRRHVVMSEIRGGATVMGDVFDDEDDTTRAAEKPLSTPAVDGDL